MYHIEAGRGFVSNANNISNIPAPASKAVYPCFLYTLLLVHVQKQRKRYFESCPDKRRFINQSFCEKLSHSLSKPISRLDTFPHQKLRKSHHQLPEILLKNLIIIKKLLVCRKRLPKQCLTRSLKHPSIPPMNPIHFHPFFTQNPSLNPPR